MANVLKQSDRLNLDSENDHKVFKFGSMEQMTKGSENLFLSGGKGGINKAKKTGRKKLQTLQKSADQKGLTLRSPSPDKKSKPDDVGIRTPKIVIEGSNSVQVYKDPSPETKPKEEDGKTAEDEAYELMVQEPIPESYWKELAEERRQALEDSLVENEQLCEEIAELKEENKRLSEKADQADYFAEVLQDLVKDQPEDTESTEPEEQVSDEGEQVSDEDDPASEDDTAAPEENEEPDEPEEAGKE